MKPVLVFRHIECEGPGYLANFLQSRGLEYRVIQIDKGEPVPATVNGAGALVFMGGPMSVNDDLPWIEKEMQLIRQAHKENMPVLGHCLGSQLISKALGGEVVKNKVVEIGWFPVFKTDYARVSSWTLNLPESFDVFHMHGEVFSVPDGAELLLKNKHCPHQAFSIDNTLALQFHIELTRDLIGKWLLIYRDDIARPAKSIQGKELILYDIDNRLYNMHMIADELYTRWVERILNR